MKGSELMTTENLNYTFEVHISLQQTGNIVSLLEYTSMVDISEIESFFQIGSDGNEFSSSFLLAGSQGRFERIAITF